MSRLSASKQREIDRRIADRRGGAGAFVARSKQRGSELQSLSLRDGRAILVAADGRITPVGEHWFRAFPDDRPAPGGLDNRQQVITKGRSQYARNSRGELLELRHYNPATKSWVYTKRGKAFFDNRQVSQWHVAIPIEVYGRRHDNSNYHFPASNLLSFLP